MVDSLHLLVVRYITFIFLVSFVYGMPNVWASAQTSERNGNTNSASHANPNVLTGQVLTSRVSNGISVASDKLQKPVTLGVASGRNLDTTGSDGISVASDKLQKPVTLGVASGRNLDTTGSDGISVASDKLEDPVTLGVASGRNLDTTGFDGISVASDKLQKPVTLGVASGRNLDTTGSDGISVASDKLQKPVTLGVASGRNLDTTASDGISVASDKLQKPVTLGVASGRNLDTTGSDGISVASDKLQKPVTLGVASGRNLDTTGSDGISVASDKLQKPVTLGVASGRNLDTTGSDGISVASDKLQKPVTLGVASGRNLDTTGSDGISVASDKLQKPVTLGVASGRNLDTTASEGISVASDKLEDPVTLGVASGKKLDTTASEGTSIGSGTTLQDPVAFEMLKAEEEKGVNSTAIIVATNNFQQEDIIKHTAATPTIAFGYLNLTSNKLSTRLSSINDKSGNALSSGDGGNVKKGFWVGAIWSETRQKQDNNIEAFKNKQHGVILGFDAEFNDNLTIGAAYTRGLSKTKFDNTANNKQLAKLHIAAVYAEYNFLSGITLNSYLEYGKAFIKSNDTTNNVSLSGKTKGDIMRAKLEAYYQYNVGTLVLKPIAGIKYDYYNIKSYKVRGQDFYVNVPSSKGKRVSLEAGIVLGKNIALNKCTISPEVHFGLEKAILVSNSSRVISVNDAATQTQIWSTRPSGSSGLRDIIYTVGGRVRVQSASRIEIGTGYDYSFKKKFSNHSVYLSSKIAF